MCNGGCGNFLFYIKDVKINKFNHNKVYYKNDTMHTSFVHFVNFSFI